MLHNLGGCGGRGIVGENTFHCERWYLTIKMRPEGRCLLNWKQDDVSLMAIVMAQLPLTHGLSEFAHTFQGLVKGICLQDIFFGIAKCEFFTSGFSQLQAFEESVGKFAHGSQW